MNIPILYFSLIEQFDGLTVNNGADLFETKGLKRGLSARIRLKRI